MKLIDNASQWWRMLVIQVAAIWSAAITVWPMLPEQQRHDIMEMLGVPPYLMGGVAGLVMFLTLLGARVKKQPDLHPPIEEQQ